MPGLSQLKKFNKDILSLGDEITLRSARGEQPIKFPIPKDVEDKNDSEDFVLGMPEKPAAVEVEVLDEDFSDITGIVTESKTDESPVVSFEAPDMSSLLNPIQDFSEDSEFGMPDLSAFMEEETPQPKVERTTPVPPMNARKVQYVVKKIAKNGSSRCVSTRWFNTKEEAEQFKAEIEKTQPEMIKNFEFRVEQGYRE